MSHRLALTLRVGPDNLVLGPPSAFGGYPDGRLIGRPGPHGREDARRWLQRACAEPGAAIRLRHQLALWTGDTRHASRIEENDLPNYLADLCARGTIAMWASRPLGGHDALTMSKVQAGSVTSGPVETWKVSARIDFVIRSVPALLSGAVRDEFLKVTAPEAIKTTTAVLTLWAASEAFGISEIIDAVLQLDSTYRLGRTPRSIADRIGHVLNLVISAQREADLAVAANQLAEILTLIGVATFVAMITQATSKASKGALKMRKESLRSGAA